MPDFDTQKPPQEPNEPGRLRTLLSAHQHRILSIANKLRTLMLANWLRTALIGVGSFFFVMVVVPGGLLIYQSSGISDELSQLLADKQANRPETGTDKQPHRPCEGIDPDAIRNGRIAFDLAGEAVPVVEDPEGMGIAAPDIWTVNPNGSNPVNLTTNPRYFDEAPAWSPDGGRIAFASSNPSDQSDASGSICVMDPDGSEGIEISLPKGETLYEPSWSPDGQTIAFWSPTDCNIFLANADGSGSPERLPTPGFSGCAARPEWSPDGGRIAFEGVGQNSMRNIYVTNVSPEGYTSGLRRLTDNRFDYDKPAWSPDGTEIAFETNRDRQSEIYKIDVRSLKVTRLTHSPLMDTEPTWSPDGEHIAYVKQKLGGSTHSSIYRMDSDGSNSTPVFEEERKYAFNPDWAP